MNREKSKKEQCQVSETAPPKAALKENKERIQKIRQSLAAARKATVSRKRVERIKIKQRQRPGQEAAVREVKLCCTTCPAECVITVFAKGDAVLHVEGNTCKRGKKFAQMELIAPERTLTSTIMVECGGRTLLMPVKTAVPIPKKMVVSAMVLIRETRLSGAFTMGDVVIPDLCGSGVDLVACRSLKEENHAR